MSLSQRDEGSGDMSSWQSDGSVVMADGRGVDGGVAVSLLAPASEPRAAWACWTWHRTTSKKKLSENKVQEKKIEHPVPQRS